MIKKIDKKNKFVSVFNQKTGFYARSGVIENGKDTGVDPFMASFPELIDIGIMGSCSSGKSGICIKSGIECYQNGLEIDKPDMPLEDFKKLIDECENKTFQVALGGRGDPDMHKDFKQILEYSREHQVIPNFTTSGCGMTEEKAEIAKEYCGAVAVSWHEADYTLKTLDLLIKKGVKTNVHFVLSQKSIQRAYELLSAKGFPEGVNAVVFLLHKPIGLGTKAKILGMDNPLASKFFDLASDWDMGIHKLGFDSCSVPGLLNLAHGIDEDSFDTCEAGRWSMYISADMKAMPCSFDALGNWEHDLRQSSIAQAWASPQFEEFRKFFRRACPGCRDRRSCMGGCQIANDIVLCGRSERELPKIS
ncbi:MAG: SPASM domain-containing protein [Clostridiales bacterium]|jgi:radical SAM protein with 4Fe4S-binding SPASM domain|nr:SPASM domain-containing protein [Clostridiales bacterium]